MLLVSPPMFSGQISSQSQWPRYGKNEPTYRAMGATYREFVLGFHVLDLGSVVLSPTLNLSFEGLAPWLLVLQHPQHRLVLRRQVAVLRLWWNKTLFNVILVLTTCVARAFVFWWNAREPRSQTEPSMPASIGLDLFEDKGQLTNLTFSDLQQWTSSWLLSVLMVFSAEEVKHTKYYIPLSDGPTDEA